MDPGLACQPPGVLGREVVPRGRDVGVRLRERRLEEEIHVETWIRAGQWDLGRVPGSGPGRVASD